MGELAGRVNVDEVDFDFMPLALAHRCPRTDGRDPDVGDIENVYAFCYQWVFGERPRGNLLKHRAIILERVREAGTSLKLFLLANMLGWKKSHQETAFYPQVLVGEFAVKQVKTYAEACQRRFGAFDITGLDRLMGSDVARQDFETQLLASETVAGAWIVNYKLFHSGNLLTRLYAEKETALSPYWLAIEKSYYDTVLVPYRSDHDPGCSDLLRKHRWNTMQVLSRLKRHERQAITVFSARERIMPEAVRCVLGQRGLLPEHFEVENVPVVNAMKFWVRLAGAIQHYEVLKFVDNFPSIYDSHFARK